MLYTSLVSRTSADGSLDDEQVLFVDTIDDAAPTYTWKQARHKCYTCRVIVAIFSLLIMIITLIKAIDFFLHTSPSARINNPAVIAQVMHNTPDTVYYFQKAVDYTIGVECVVLSRYEVFENTTSLQTHQDILFCLDENDDEFASQTPAIIANDRHLIACVDVINKDNDYCLFVTFIGDQMEKMLDINGNDTLFNGVTLSARALKSFAFYGDQLFGVDVAQQALLHWDISGIQTSRALERIPLNYLNITSDDVDISADRVYPIRLEVHDGLLYLFQRFEAQRAVEVSKISYFGNGIQETGIGWLYDEGHERLFDDFANIDGFIFDANMNKYFMFSDCELRIDSDGTSADIYLDSDFKFKFNETSDWTSYYQIKIPIARGINHTELSEDIKMAYLDYSHDFVYFPIQFKEYHDSIYFMEIQDVRLVDDASIEVKFHPLLVDVVDYSPLESVVNETVVIVSGKSVLQVVSGKDSAIQYVVDKMDLVHDEEELSEVVEQYSKHKWADLLYNILQIKN
eukprot:95755_1